MSGNESDSQTESESESPVASTGTEIYILSQKLTEAELEGLKSIIKSLGGIALSELTTQHKIPQNRNRLLFLSNSKAPKLVATWIKKAFKIQEIDIDGHEMNSLSVVRTEWLTKSAKANKFKNPTPFLISLVSKPKPSALLNSASNFKTDSNEASTSKSSYFSKKRVEREGSGSEISESEKVLGKVDKGKGKAQENYSSSSPKRPKISSNENERSSQPNSDEDDPDSDLEEAREDLPSHLDVVTVLEPNSPVPDHKSSMAFACQRATPYKCINQSLVDELNLIRAKRALYQTSAISSISGNSGLVKAISAIKSFKYDLTTLPNPSGAAKTHMMGVGQATQELLKIFYKNRKGGSIEGCKIQEAEEVRNKKRELKMIQFSELKGMNPMKSKKYYQLDGIKSLKELIRKKKTRLGTGLPSRRCEEIRKQVIRKIGRLEIEEIGKEVVEEMKFLCPDLKHSLVGSYRRGHPFSDSVELVFTSPTLGDAKDAKSLNEDSKTTPILDELMDRFIEDGKTFERVAIFAPKAYEDSEPISPLSILSFAYLPSRSYSLSSIPLKKPIYRIVEINLCRPDVYGAQVLARTGSKLFVTDLKKFAEEKNEFLYHQTGLSRLDEPDVIVPTRTEKEVFELLKLPYMPPHMRNCDP